MPPSRLAADTDTDIERRQIEGWRAMTPVQKAGVVSGLTRAVFEVARAGVRARYPNATPHEHSLRLAIEILGLDLASRAYPDVAHLPALEPGPESS